MKTQNSQKYTNFLNLKKIIFLSGNKSPAMQYAEKKPN